MKLRARVVSPAQPQTQQNPPKAVIKEEPVKVEPVVATERPAIEEAIEEAVKLEPVKAVIKEAAISRCLRDTSKEEPVTEVRPKQAVQRCRSINPSIGRSINRSMMPQLAPKKRNPIIGIRI